jgi:hypothetical protein
VNRKWNISQVVYGVFAFLLVLFCHFTGQSEKIIHLEIEWGINTKVMSTHNFWSDFDNQLIQVIRFAINWLLTVSLFSKFPTFMVHHHIHRSWVRWIQFISSNPTPPPPISQISISKLSFHQCLSLPSGLFSGGFSTRCEHSVVSPSMVHIPSTSSFMFSHHDN